MEEFKTQLMLLTDILTRKKFILRQILGITENQETILKSPGPEKDLDLIFTQMNDEKQKLIDELLNADNFFQRIFSDLGSELERQSPNFKDIIKGMQELIMEVTDLDVKIRVQEQLNRASITRSFQRQKADFNKSSKGYLLNQYKKNNTKNDA